MIINKRIETIFAHAVALTQSGRLKSTIYCRGKLIYILNQDHTVILRFIIKDKKFYFKEPVSFTANDYDSNQVEMKDGMIQFIQEEGGFIRVKSCKTPHMTPDNVHEIFQGYKIKNVNEVRLHKKALTLLDPVLSHVEFSVRKGSVCIIQRNIYSGAVIKLTRKKSKGSFGIMDVKDKSANFKPVGIRTGDLIALFSFVDFLTFRFQPKGNWVAVESEKSKIDMTALIGLCQYDELGGVDSGRKVEKKGRRLKSINRKDQARKK